MGWIRVLFMGVAIVFGIVILSVFLNLFIKIAALLFLIAFAYYWFVKAKRLRKDSRNW